jgi:Tfp pilus assembly major pilin PilA
MNGFKRCVLVAAMVAAVLATVAGPAYATVANTSSVTNSAPWWAPIGNTVNSRVTGKAPSLSFVVPGAGAITCPTQFSGYVPVTHTKLNITGVQFGNCTSTMGTISAAETPVNSVTPWVAHVTFLDSSGSATGTINIPTNSHISIHRTQMGMQCDLTIPEQSIRFTWTNDLTSMTINEPTVSFTGNGGGLCPPVGTTMQMIGTFTLLPDTVTDNLNVVAVST